ncbi:MAG: hypothetical protein ACREPA_07945 [Candidatus Dormibacteraceae bacterium]
MLDAADARCRTCGRARERTGRSRRGMPADFLPRFVTNLFAAAAILLLVGEAQLAAYLVAPGGPPQLLAGLGRAGFTYSDPQTAIWELTVLPPLGCALHIAAYFGLRARRAWGWILALLVSLLWCFFLVGLPVLFLLVRRGTRRAFGMRF